MRSRTAPAIVVGVLLVSAVLGGFALASAGPADSAKPAFPARSLLPGDSVTGSIRLPAAPVDVSPLLNISHLRQSCAARTCSHRASLANVLRLTVTAASGASWSRTVGHLSHPLPMPGGVLPAHGAATYQLKLSLPAAADNRYENLALSAVLVWREQGEHSVPSSGSRPITTHVRGEKVVRTGQGATDDSLPFTGFDVLLVLLAGASLVAAGSVITVGTRQRKRQGSGR